MATGETRSPLDAAQEMAPTIRSCADRIEKDRELPRPLFEALAAAGLFELLIPRTVGGAEVDLPTYVRVLEELGKADASTGWVVNQCAVFATYAAQMPRDIARLIWIDTPHSVVANTPVATAQAVVVPGGYRVSGRQGFSSGCRHAAWLAARALIQENGQPRLSDGQPEERYLFVPAAEAELLDTWNVRGMRGTGTHHFVVKDIFVPAERTVLQAGAPLLESGPLYQFPRRLLFASGDAAVALGTARGCLDAFFDLAGAKTPALHAGHPAGSTGDSSDRRPQRSSTTIRARLFDRIGARHLERGGVHRCHQLGPARRPPSGYDPCDSAGGGRRRFCLQCLRRYGDLRRQPDPALLPRHSRDQPAYPGPPRPLRIDRKTCAGTEGRSSAILIRTYLSGFER